MPRLHITLDMTPRISRIVDQTGVKVGYIREPRDASSGYELVMYEAPGYSDSTARSYGEWNDFHAALAEAERLVNHWEEDLSR
jgi:hypothetical protein